MTRKRSAAGRRFGRLHLPDPRDKQWRIPRLAPSGRESRYWNDNGWWGDQGETPHCVGYGWAHWLEDGPITHGGKAPIVSPGTIYAEAQRLDEWDGEDYDGTSVRAGAKALAARGWIAEYRWAATWEDVERTLLEVGPLVVGTYWTLAMSEPNARGVIHPDGPIVGGHCYVLNGISRKTGMIRGKNSWGRGWGYRGHLYMPIPEMRDLLFDDGEACLAIEMAKVKQ